MKKFRTKADAFAAQQKCSSGTYGNPLFSNQLSGIATASFSRKDIVESLAEGTAGYRLKFN
ncbi:hypothetical protein [Mucilaginibacter sp.]